MLGFYRIDLAKARRRYLICRGIFARDLRAAEAKSRIVDKLVQARRCYRRNGQLCY